MVWKYLKRSQIENSPSRVKGVTKEEEQNLRREWASFLQRAGFLLELPLMTTCSAVVFFQRFYCTCSFSEFDPFLTGCSALLLASKAEENSRRPRDVINVCFALLHKLEAPPEVSQTYWTLKDRVITNEQLLLRVFGFDLELLHPHQFLLHFIRNLEGPEELANMAWYILNDSLSTTLSLQYKPQALACAAAYLAAELMPDIEFAHGEWWTKYETSRLELEDICLQLVDLYETGDPLPSSPALHPSPALTGTYQPPTAAVATATSTSPAMPASTSSSSSVSSSTGTSLPHLRIPPPSASTLQPTNRALTLSPLTAGRSLPYVPLCYTPSNFVSNYKKEETLAARHRPTTTSGGA